MAQPEDARRLRELIMGFRATQLIYVAARLGLADRIAQGPRSADDLARDAGADPGALFRLLRALASLGIFAETNGRFAMTPLAEMLRRDTPGSLHSTAMLYGDGMLWRAYGALAHAVETGKPAFDRVYGEPFYDYLGHHADAAALFHEAMTGFSGQEAAAILGAYDFSQYRAIVDIGGGQGALMAAVLRANPGTKAIIFDRSPPAPDVQQSFAQAGIAGRAEFKQGDFFAAAPGGGDLYLLKSIIHNWDDDASTTILSRCRAAMPSHGRLLIAERVVPPGNAPSEAKLFDINMLVTLGGLERTEAQYATLLRNAGLTLARVIPTSSHLSLIEATPAASPA